MNVGLLDVNVLIALAWPSHIHHRQAHTWFAANGSTGWATCPLTECAFVRISSNPKIIADAVSPREAGALLKEMGLQGRHHFWADDIPFNHESVPQGLLVGHRQVIGAYLLGLAIRREGRLVTLDHGLKSLLPHASPHRKSLEILPV